MACGCAKNKLVNRTSNPNAVVAAATGSGVAPIPQITNEILNTRTVWAVGSETFDSLLDAQQLSVQTQTPIRRVFVTVPGLDPEPA
jgi:hypothetical protein